MNRVQIAVTEIRNMNTDELSQVIEAVKMQRTWLARTMTRALTVGDVVEFDARGRVVRGTVTKINRKTLQVREAGNGLVNTNWKVTASLVRLAEPA